MSAFTSGFSAFRQQLMISFILVDIAWGCLNSGQRDGEHKDDGKDLHLAEVINVGLGVRLGDDDKAGDRYRR
ncbi:uncharacterized protein MELLADRAFT_54567 [Melampsora larici-populina 98AG31]|uniref:Secreted protein n=1 Tax=Melampsora larici-populina (strain 98AG31 / pathotype 3-4-7) TaxID=747676 RepID=F4R4S9_MELLP|nr:uncharacterized protein MELLADRAFT_54567 [Melampsora larici-populina 98AG31]EGG12948.1 secreted protein [Melampsora larici-populina 98AG31]